MLRHAGLLSFAAGASAHGSCSLSCRTEVPSGWTGHDEGPEACNTCSCSDGDLTCTLEECPPTKCPGTANMTAPHRDNLGIINGRTTSRGQWDGVVMVVGSNGQCSGGLCSGTFIHPRVVMTAAHCCSGTKAICGGKTRPGTRLAYSISMSRHSSGANDYCLLRLNQAVTNVPIYEVCTSAQTGDATIVGYGVRNSAQQGAGTQRDGAIRVTGVSGYDISLTGRSGQTYQNACNGDSGGPIFLSKGSGVCVSGACSRGPPRCPNGATAIYTNAADSRNVASLRSATSGWGSAVTPGSCPVTQCCYGMTGSGC